MLELSENNDVQKVIDTNNRDVLIARRLEVFFQPNTDGSPSVNGKIIWHTEWLHMSGDVARGTSIGPQIERTIEQVLSGNFGGIPGEQVIAAVKAAYIAHALEHFTPPVVYEE